MKQAVLLFLSLFTASLLQANNIQVANVVLTDEDAGAGTTQIQFDLSWENSWRISVGPGNYDAAWVFAKYRVNGQSWRHASLSSSGAMAATGATIDIMDNVGAFVYRSAEGSGDIDFSNLQLRWDYDDDGVDPNAVVDIQVFAIEMVYVPDGAFSMGTSFSDRPNINGEFYTLPNFGFAFPMPYRVENEAAITVANSAGNLYYNNTEGLGEDGIGDQLGPIPAAFPKGTAAFYCMKYEVSQEQWVAFFNTLTPTQKTALDVTGVNGKNTDNETFNNGISWPDAGNVTTTLPYSALNYVSATSSLAYLDWSGLRPFTELEYEKACRGPLSPVPSEFAWGNGNIHNEVYTYLNEGTEIESIANPGVGTGNAIVSPLAPAGPRRVGIVAASATNSTREESGGSYYGIMDLTGNLYEHVVTVGNPQGRAFTGLHGDGFIISNGSANVAGWPSSALGIGYRGGSFANQIPFIFVSDRTDAANEIVSGNSRLGFRGVRTAQ